MPLVSVIVPIYNVEPYLKECIDSVLAQTYKNIEIILVDDGSPDNCGKICDEYKKLDDRIIVIHKENGGLSSARNAGLDICKGEYISFIDSDDYVSPYFIEILYKGIRFNDADVTTIIGAEQFYVEGNERPQLASSNTDYIVESLDKDEAIKKLCYQTIANGSPFRLYKKKIFDEIRFPIGFVFEDVATTYRTFIAANKLSIVNAKVYAYRVRRDSIVRMAFSEKKMVVIPITQTMFKELCEYDSKFTNAAASRAFAQNYHVFLQVPFRDKRDLKLIWNEMLKYRGYVIKDKNKLVRKKNKIGALTTYLGLNAAYWLGRLYLRLR